MAILDKKVSEIYSGRDISSLSDRPNQDGLDGTQLKARFDQLGKEVIPKLNALIDELFSDLYSGTSQDGHTHNLDNLVDGITYKLFTALERAKLSAIAENAEVNQNAFSNVKVGSTTIASSAKTDTFELVAGLNVSLAVDSLTKKITLSATGDLATEAVQSYIEDIGNYFTSLNVEGALQEVGANLTEVKSQLAHITTLGKFNSLAEAIANGGAIQVKNEFITVNADIVSGVNAFTVEGQGANASALTGNYSFVIDSLKANGFRNIKLECIDSTKDRVIDFTNTGSTVAVIDSLYLMNLFKHGIRIKRGFGHIIRDSFIYGRTNGIVGTGLELSPVNNDWNNVVNITNCNFAWLHTGINLGAVVTANILGTHVGFSVYGIVLKTTPPNPTRDILIQGGYFEALNVAIKTLEGDTGIIEGLKIKDCFFSVGKIAELKRVNNLKFEDCTHADNGTGRTPVVELERIGNLVIENSGQLDFKTSLNNPIITTGQQNYSENILTKSNLVSDYSLANCTVKDSNTDGVKRLDSPTLPASITLAPAISQALLTKRLAFGTSTGDASSFLSSRGVGGKLFVKATGKCKVSVHVTDGTVNIIINTVNVSDQWVCLEGFCITGIFPETADISFMINIVPLDASTGITVYMYEAQCWLDFAKAPAYIENIYDYPMFKRPIFLKSLSLDSTKGLFLPTNTFLEKTNSSIFTVETQKGWRVSKAGYNNTNVNLWVASTSYIKGDYVRLSTGQVLLCTKTGISGLTEPTTSSGVSTKLCPKDNTVSWFALSSGSLIATFVNDLY